MNLRVAILYQTKASPVVDGIVKPMKEGGYSDSGADIALALVQNKVEVITPVELPKTQNMNEEVEMLLEITKENMEKTIFKNRNVY